MLLTRKVHMLLRIPSYSLTAASERLDLVVKESTSMMTRQNCERQ